MKNKIKNLNAKNLAQILIDLKDQSKFEIIKEVLNKKEISSFLPQVLEILKRKLNFENSWNSTTVISKTDLSLETLEILAKAISVEKSKIQKQIDSKMSAGVIIKNGAQYINATFEKMLHKVLS
jgi:F0F1-type ATP synthase delta subunit